MYQKDYNNVKLNKSINGVGVSRGVFHWGVGLWCFGSCGLRGGVSVGQDCLGAAHGSLMGLWSRRFAGLGLSVVHCLWCGEAHCPAGCWSATVFRWVAFECQHSIREILLEHAEKQLEATLAANSHETVSSWVSPWVTQAPRFHEEEQTSTPEDVEFKKKPKKQDTSVFKFSETHSDYHHVSDV